MKHLDWVKGAVIWQIFPDRFAKSASSRADGVYFMDWEGNRKKLY